MKRRNPGDSACTGRLNRAAAIFEELVGVPVEQRSSLLAVRCDGDEALRTLVGQLLSHDERGLGDFLQRRDMGGGAARPDAARIAAVDDLPTAAPTRIGRYRIVRELGRGGAGVVYEAVQDSPARAVALKVIGAGMLSPDALRRFSHEVEILGGLQHPGIAQVYEAGTADVHGPLGVATGAPYFAMELVHGDTLTRYAARAGLDTRGRLELLARVCDAVQYAHQRGVIHRDLKPGNILVAEAGAEGWRGKGFEGSRGQGEQHSGAPNRGGALVPSTLAPSALRTLNPSAPRTLNPSTPSPQPKVLDFGIARATGDDFQTRTLRTEVGQIVGTVPYMSPEQLSGDSRQIDTRSDVYALGVVLFELLSGALPHDVAGRSIHEAVRLVRDEPPRPLGALRPALRGEVETLCAKALHRDREQRYQSASALADDIRRYLTGAPIEAKRDSLGYVLRKRLRQHWIAVTVAAAFVLLLVGGLATSLTLWRQAALALDEKEEQRRIADEQRAGVQMHGDTIDSMYQFLGKMLRGANRRVEGGRADVTVREMLDRAAKEIDAGALKSPTVEAGLRNMIGVTYQSLGIYDAAEKHLRRALEIRETFQVKQSLVLDELWALAKLYWESERLAEAEPLVRRAVALEGQLYPDDLNKRAVAHNNMGSLLLYQRKTDEAEQEFLTSLDLRRREPNLNRRETAQTLNNLAVLANHRRDYAAARDRAAEAVELFTAVSGAESDRTAAATGSLAKALVYLGDVRTAERLARRALGLTRKLHGDKHPNVASEISTLALILRMDGQFAESETLYREALEIRRTRVSADNKEPRALTAALAETLLATGRANEAEELLASVVALAREDQADQEGWLGVHLCRLSEAVAAQGRYADAEPIVREALAFHAERLSSDHWSIADTESVLGGILAGRGATGDAEALLLAAWSKLDGSSAAPWDRKQLALDRIIGFYERLQRDGEAATWRSKRASWQATTQPAAPIPAPSR